MAYFRVHLKSMGDEDSLTVYLPLDADGNLDRRGHSPWLVKTVWDGYMYYGELIISDDGAARLEWGGDSPDSNTDLGTAPLRMNSIVTVFESEPNSPKYLFVVANIVEV